jgi:hypothetical protein
MSQPGATHVDTWNSVVAAGSGEEGRSDSETATLSMRTATMSSLSNRSVNPSAPTRDPSSHKMLFAELVDEEEIRLQAREEAQLELKRMMEEAAVATATVVSDGGDKAKCGCCTLMNIQRRHLPLILACCLLAVVATIVWVWVAFALLGGGGGENENNDKASPNTTQALFWREVGGGIGGLRDGEQFGLRIAFSADGNTLIGSGYADEDHIQVRAYS